MPEQSLLDFIEHGGVAVYPLLLFSIVSVAVVIERAWAIGWATRGARRLHGIVLEAARRADVRGALAAARLDGSPLGRIYEAALTARSEDGRARMVRRRHAEGTRHLRHYVWLLGTIGSLAPFIGLFGTVIGIIRAFGNMAATGSGGFAVVAAGISEALIATAFGLVVGILSIFAYNAYMVRIAEISAVWHEWTEDLLLSLTEARPRESKVADAS